MKISLYAKVIELGKWVCNDGWNSEWKTEQVLEDGEQVDFYIKESCKKDVDFGRGAYISPRFGWFRISSRFVGTIDSKDLIELLKSKTIKSKKETCDVSSNLP